MTVLIKKSVCLDCIWRNSCQQLERINGMDDNRNNPLHTNDIFEVIILKCSVKNYDRSYNINGKEKNGMYYCTDCNKMHHEWSGIGKVHKLGQK